MLENIYYKHIVGATLLLFGVCNTAFTATAMNGWYGTFYGGFAIVPDNVNAAGFTNVDYDDAFNIGGVFGFKKNSLRYEGEIAYIRTNVQSFDFNSTPSTTATGDNNAIAFLLNVLYDFENKPDQAFVPFVGGGLGFARVKTELIGSTANHRFRHFRASENEFTYQLMGGANYNISPTLAVGVYYRYLGTSSIEKLGKRYQTHNVNLGITYRFEDIYI